MKQNAGLPSGADGSHRNLWDDDDSIPTEVLGDMNMKENSLALIDIVNNLNQFVMGIIYFILIWLKIFLEPTRQNITMKCKITREKKGVDRLFPIYYLHLDKGDNRKVKFFFIIFNNEILLNSNLKHIKTKIFDRFNLKE